MTPEGAIKEAVKTLLKRYGAYKHMPVQNGMGEPALDFHVCHKGFYAAIETKAKGKHLTARQLRTARQVQASGGSLFFIDDTSPARNDFASLVGWLVAPFAGFTGFDMREEFQWWDSNKTLLSNNLGKPDYDLIDD